MIIVTFIVNKFNYINKKVYNTQPNKFKSNCFTINSFLQVKKNTLLLKEIIQIFISLELFDNATHAKTRTQ